MPTTKAAVKSETEPHHVEKAKRLITDALQRQGLLTRQDLLNILHENPELVLDDLDVAVNQLSGQHVLRHSVRGYKSVS